MKNLFILSLCLAGTASFAQQYELKPDEMRGSIITEEGKELTGYIKLKGDALNPWNNQNSVEFFTEEAIADGKVKGKERQKFKPKDIKGYKAGDRYFESMKISAAKLSLGIGIATWTFVERFTDGQIKMYRLYETPDAVTVTTSEAEKVAHEQELERMRNEPFIVLQKGEEDHVLITKVNLSDYLSDCPEVEQKYRNGDYGIEPFNPDGESKIGQFIARQHDANVVESVLPQIINDYNVCVQ